jgi:hypothetical protein
MKLGKINTKKEQKYLYFCKKLDTFIGYLFISLLKNNNLISVELT